MDKLYLFVIVAGSLIAFIAVYRLRGIIGLSLIRGMYGKYSFEYVSLSKKLIKKRPFKYCFRDEFISHVLFILDKKQELPSYKTHSPINFEDQPFFTSYKEILKVKGEPSCFNAYSFQNPDFTIKVLGYKENISGKKGITAYYFIDDIFFMGEYILKDTSDHARNSCINAYSDSGNIMGDNFYIENTTARIIHFQNSGFSIDVKFLSRENDEIIRTLKEYHDHMTRPATSVEV